MSQTLRQRRVLCKQREIRPSRDEPAVLRVLPPPPPKRVIREDAPQLGAVVRIALWLGLVGAALIKIASDTGLLG